VMHIELPKELPEEQRDRLMQIAAKCPVHRALEGEVMFEETVELR
jgi:putative redox protein